MTVTDPVAHRLEVARSLGADVVVRPGVDDAPGPADTVLECTGVQPAVDLAIASCAPAATMVLVGTGATITLPLDVVQARELTLRGTFRYAHAYPAAIELADSGAIALDAMVTSRHDLDGAVDALLAARRDATAIKAVVRP